MVAIADVRFYFFCDLIKMEREKNYQYITEDPKRKWQVLGKIVVLVPNVNFLDRNIGIFE